MSMERELFAKEILGPIGQNSRMLGDSEVAGFRAITGHRYSGELMVVGRATNGWLHAVRTSELADADTCDRHASKVYEEAADACPMKWVSDIWADPNSKYKTGRSAFWRVIRAVLGNLDVVSPNDAAWPSHLAWTNLYKVAPYEGGNPNAALCKAQLPGCISLLQAEIAARRPRRILFLTGHGWAKPFLDAGAPGVKPVDGHRYVNAVGTMTVGDNSARVVVAEHPQGKAEDVWVREVTGACRAA